jgi:hypothetical protein
VNKDRQLQSLRSELIFNWLIAVLFAGSGLVLGWTVLYASNWMESVGRAMATVLFLAFAFGWHFGAAVAQTALRAIRKTPASAVLTVGVEGSDTDADYSALLEFNNMQWRITIYEWLWDQSVPYHESIRVLVYTDLRNHPVLLETATDFVQCSASLIRGNSVSVTNFPNQ